MVANGAITKHCAGAWGIFSLGIAIAENLVLGKRVQGVFEAREATRSSSRTSGLVLRL